MPSDNISSIWRCTSGLSSSGTLYAFKRLGVKSEVILISCSNTGQYPGLSTNTAECRSKTSKSCFCSSSDKCDMIKDQYAYSGSFVYVLPDLQPQLHQIPHLD